MSAELEKMHLYCYSWTILNLPICPTRPGKYICSPPFTAQLMGNTKWNLVFFPKGKNNSEYMSVFLQRKTDCSESKEIMIDFKIAMYGINSLFRCMKLASNACFKEEELFGFPEFAPCISPNIVDRTLSYDAFMIQCELSPSDAMTNNDRWNPRVDLESLSTNLADLFEYGTNYDLVLSCRGVQIPVHRAVLMARSPRFMRDPCLIGSCTEKDLSGISPSILYDFLHYLYSGKMLVPRDGTQLMALAAVAIEFEVEDLLHRIRTHPKSYIARTALQRERKYVTYSTTVLDSTKVGDAISCSRVEKCELVYCDALCIFCQVVHDAEWGNGNYVNLSFALTGIQPDCPVFVAVKVGMMEGEYRECEVAQLCEGHHVFETDVPWYQTIPVLNIPLQVGAEFSFGIQIDLCDGTSINFLREENVIVENICPIGLDNLRPFSRDFKALFNRGDFTDFTIFCDKETFRVHRAVLIGRSRVFEKMLEHDMTEKRTGRVFIPDVRPTVMWIMLSYIYTGVLLELCHEEVCDLYEASDKYELFVLNDRCRSIMSQNLNAASVSDVLALAHLHCDLVLIGTARQYILANNLRLEDGLQADLHLT